MFLIILGSSSLFKFWVTRATYWECVQVNEQCGNLWDNLGFFVDILRYSGYFASFCGYSILAVFWISDTKEGGYVGYSRIVTRLL